MKKEESKSKDKSKEPFPPENTPQPPQVMDASKAPEQKDDRASQAGDSKKRPSDEEQGKKKKLLGESPLEIDDETTI